jgi:GntR family transcriptional repressor for pyruvate dehydrogenase complex
MAEAFRVERTPVHEQVRDHLQDLIRSGQFEPGSALPPERVLADRLGVSRHTLRQAISSLEAVGLVESRHGSGVFLTSTPSDEAVIRFADVLYDPQRTLSDVLEARLGVEPLITRLAAHRRTDSDLARLAQSIAVAAHPPETDETTAAADFHQELARITGNPVLEGILRSLVTGPRSISRLTDFDPASRRHWESEHTAILRAIAAGKESKAERLMTDHLVTIHALALQVEGQGEQA